MSVYSVPRPSVSGWLRGWVCQVSAPKGTPQGRGSPSLHRGALRFSADRSRVRCAQCLAWPLEKHWMPLSCSEKSSPCFLME